MTFCCQLPALVGTRRQKFSTGVKKIKRPGSAVRTAAMISYLISQLQPESVSIFGPGFRHSIAQRLVAAVKKLQVIRHEIWGHLATLYNILILAGIVLSLLTYSRNWSSNYNSDKRIGGALSWVFVHWHIVWSHHRVASKKIASSES